MTEVLNLYVNGSITCHAWNKDRTQIALSPNSKDVLIYSRKTVDANVWRLEQTLSEHSSKVLSIDWAPESNNIVTCGADKNAYVWSTTTTTGEKGTTWKPELVVLRINRAAVCVKWSPNEKKFAVGCGHRCICVCYYEQNQGFWVAKHIKKQIRSTTLSIAWHPSNILLAAGGTDFKCRLFGAHVADVDGPAPTGGTPWGAKISSADCIAEYAAANHGWIHSCVFSSDGLSLAFVGHDSTVYAVNTRKSVKDVITLRTPFLPLLTVRFVSNDTLLAAGHDCYPIAFKLDETSPKGIAILHKYDLDKSVSSVSASAEVKSTGFATAKGIFGNRERTGNQVDEKSHSKALSTVHQNSIKQICTYKEDVNTKVTSHVSTCGLDGQVVIWDLNVLEQKLASLKLK